MSKVVEFRNRVITAFQDLGIFNDVNWYDGLFDEADIKDWSVRSPAAFVSVRRSAEPYQNAKGTTDYCLRCVVTLIAQDYTSPRDADETMWDLIEKTIALVNLNYFGDPNVGPANKVTFQRLVDPELRREGVAVGIVEWQQSMELGENWYDRRDRIMNGLERVTQVPMNVSAHTTVTKDGEMNILTNSPDQVTFTETEKIYLEDDE